MGSIFTSRLRRARKTTSLKNVVNVSAARKPSAATRESAIAGIGVCVRFETLPKVSGKIVIEIRVALLQLEMILNDLREKRRRVYGHSPPPGRIGAVLPNSAGL